MSLHLGLHRRLQQVLDWLESAGLVSHWLTRFVLWWKHFGLIHALAVLFAILFPAAKYALVPQIAAMMASTMAEGYSLDLEVEDWSADLLGLRVTAEDLTVKTRGPYRQENIFTAREISLDLSVWRRLRTGWWTNELSVVDGELYLDLERLNSGRWNWEDMVRITPGPMAGPRPDASPDFYRVSNDAESQADELGFYFPRLEVKNLEVEWVESLPGHSGGGG